jgi:hypothetical protein
MPTSFHIRNIFFFVLFLQVSCACINLMALPLQPVESNDTIEIPETFQSPIFDGIGNESCWQLSQWHPINQVWIPWGTQMDPSDFSGRYKVLWSASENILYFMLEITDDIVSDAYFPGVTAAIYNFDMFEVFIDENRSGGYHVFDGTADDESSLGTNAENAFAYHIFTKFPESGSTIDTFRVEDLGGTDWAHVINEIYNAHFPNFILRKEGNINTWEFSLIVYDDNYSPGNIENSKVTLTTGKIMGLSLAYNDDDEPEVDPTLTERDNFIGSVAVTEAAYNDHWKNANDFAPAKLISAVSPVESYRNTGNLINIFPNPTANDITVQVLNNYTGRVKITLYSYVGEEIVSRISQKLTPGLTEHFALSSQPGLYTMELCFGENRFYRFFSYLQ